MLKKQKEIKTNYKVAVVANQLEKRIRESVATYASSRYQVFMEKNKYSGGRHIYVTPENVYGSLTHFVITDVFSVVDSVAKDYKCGAICYGVETYKKGDERYPAIFVSILKD